LSVKYGVFQPKFYAVTTYVTFLHMVATIKKTNNEIGILFSRFPKLYLKSLTNF